MHTEIAKRKLTAILYADAKEYSRLMSEDELKTIQILNEYRRRLVWSDQGKTLTIRA